LCVATAKQHWAGKNAPGIFRSTRRPSPTGPMLPLPSYTRSCPRKGGRLPGDLREPGHSQQHRLRHDVGAYLEPLAADGRRRTGQERNLQRRGGQGRAAALREAWLSVLFSQFHDILPGSGVHQTREHATALFQEVAAAAGAIKRTPRCRRSGHSCPSEAARS